MSYHLHAALQVTRDEHCQCCYNSCMNLPVGPGTASDGSGERWTAHHIVRATHYGAGHVRESGSNHNAGPCIWCSGTTAGKVSKLNYTLFSKATLFTLE